MNPSRDGLPPDENRLPELPRKDDPSGVLVPPCPEDDGGRMKDDPPEEVSLPDRGDDEPLLPGVTVGGFRPAGGMKVVGGVLEPDPDDRGVTDGVPVDLEPPGPTVKGTFAPPDCPTWGVEDPPLEPGVAIETPGALLPAGGGFTVDGAPLEPPEKPDRGPLLGLPAGGAEIAGFGVEGARKPEDGCLTVGVGAVERFELIDGERKDGLLLRDGAWKLDRPELLRLDDL